MTLLRAAAVVETPEQREARLTVEFQRRFAFLQQSFATAFKLQQSSLTLNDSLRAAVRALNPRSRRRPKRKRVNLGFELVINMRALELASQRDPLASNFRSGDVRQAALQVVAQLTPRRGRPANDLLRWHVHAFMALYRQTCGRDLRARIVKDGAYEPGFSSQMDQLFLILFRAVDPAATLTAIANIVKDAHASGVVQGKCFEDFFPFYGGGVDPDSGLPVPGPGYRLEQFVPLTPIYSS